MSQLKQLSSQADAGQQGYRVPTKLVRPLWMRSQESLVDNGLIYDPIAAQACRSCRLAPDCLHGDIEQQQLLYATLTQICDQRVRQFLQEYPQGWIINVGAGLDTRFYRLDNGHCHWIELDVNENLIWRQRLFHQNERYFQNFGSVNDMSWLNTLQLPVSSGVLFVCESALLDCQAGQVAHFVQSLARHVDNAQLCMVLAGDLTASRWGQKLGAQTYEHGFSDAAEQVMQWVPWAHWVTSYSPLQNFCPRWKMWQRWLSKVAALRQRLLPVVVHCKW